MADRTFAERLKELREKAGLTQAELAERAGMHRFGVAKLEQGVREPSWATVQALCRALGVRSAAFEEVASGEPDGQHDDDSPPGANRPEEETPSRRGTRGRRGSGRGKGA